MFKLMVPMGTDQAESHTARKFRKISVCPAPVDVQVMLFSISSISILSSVVAMSEGRFWHGTVGDRTGAQLLPQRFLYVQSSAGMY